MGARRRPVAAATGAGVNGGLRVHCSQAAPAKADSWLIGASETGDDVFRSDPGAARALKIRTKRSTFTTCGSVA